MKRLLKALFLIFAAGLGVHAADKPADVLDLRQWKLTVPYPGPGGQSPLEIYQPELGEFNNSKCFFVENSASGVVFRAHCADTTTISSRYPRCELREMAPLSHGHKHQKVAAKWSTDDGILHRMTIKQAITAVPPVKKHVVAGQIHDKDDDVIMIRLEDDKLFVERNEHADVMLDANYKLGIRFMIRIEAYDGHIKVWYNGKQKMDWPHPQSGCYFKAGCYTQSNTDKGDKPESYGEVVIYSLAVEHIDPLGAKEDKPRQEH